jgi:hypothetical protein
MFRYLVFMFPNELLLVGWLARDFLQRGDSSAFIRLSDKKVFLFLRLIYCFL